MATDGPTPPPCSDELMKRGTVVLVTHTIPPNAFEGWLAKVRERCGQKIDWHFVGGRIQVLAMGDLEAVHVALEALRAEHDELFKTEARKSLYFHNVDILPQNIPWRRPDRKETPP